MLFRSYPVKDAKYLSYYKNRLAFPTQLADARLCVLANGRELLAGLENSTACYVVQDEDCVYTVNYHDGTLIRYRFSEEGLHEESIVRYGLLGMISLLSPGYLLSVERCRARAPAPDHYLRLSSLLDPSISQSSPLVRLHSTPDCQPGRADL